MMNHVLLAASSTIEVQYGSIVPELVLAGGGLALLLGSSLVRERISTSIAAFISILLALGAMASTYWVWRDLTKSGAYSTFAGAIAHDKFALFFVVILCSALVLSILVSTDWLEARGHRGPEYFVLMLLSTSGAVLMAAANDLIVIFLGLEILSLALYVLVGFDRKSEASREAALKYFLLGGFSSAIFLYGIALVYGAAGSTNLTSISTFLAQNTLLDNGLLLAGLALLVVGFAFKVAAAPFHQWTPDVYEGAPTPVVAFMAAAAKAGAFAAFLRVFAGTFSSLKLDWQPLLLGLAIVTLLVGSIVACIQQNVKRMLAYSSISHAGFILLGLQLGNVQGVSSALFYLLAYTFMVVGSFAVVTLVGGQSSGSRQGIEAFRGLASRSPGVALIFALLLLAQAGVPLTSGFLAKFYVISALVEDSSYVTAVFAMITAAIAAFFYLRLVVVMYTGAKDEMPLPASGVSGLGGGVAAAVRPITLPFATALALGLSVVFTIGIGVLPDGKYMIDTVKFAQTAASHLFVSASAPAGR
jgi:NADH-quinone oxidoreductase subunit N